MTGSTKILTVSYGTFSCTLEGFDDPFGTMRGIAEYFRDLAADDRYFGAEPPTPDVEMLQRIAEKEVQRRVEARVGETSIALTQVARKDDRPKAKAPEPKPQAARREAAQKVEEDDLDHGPLTIEDDFLLSDEPEDVLAVDPEARPPSDGPAESVAEKLRRIRAVVSRSIEPEVEEADRSFSSGQAPSAEEEAAPKRSRALTETIRQISADLSDDEDADAEPESRASENVFEAEIEVETEIEVVAEVVEPQIEAPVAETDSEVPAEVDEDDGWDFDDEPELKAAANDDGWDFEDEPEVAVEAEASASDEGDWSFDAAVEEVDEELADEVVDVAEQAATVEREKRTLSRVLRRGKDRVEDEAPKAEETRAEQADEPAARREPKPMSPLSDDNADLGRLIAETDNHLADDEGIRRRRVISQMRAAVAATKADRLASRRVSSREAEDAAEQAPYRGDLDAAVREGSKPQPTESSERKTSVAPLVLVSSQRVMVDEPARAPESTAGFEGFANFAKSMGASGLSELMEAAAAYASFVEGQTSFSRPEIMKRVARVDPALRLSREDGLRSFGQLLRQGTFRKLERGQFTIAETTRYKPQRRIAGE